MKKLGLICLVIVIAIGSAGVAYASWSQSFNINGTVGLGSYDVIFNSFTAPANGPYQTAFAATPSTSDAPHRYNISLSNVYPGCDAVFTFVLKDTGTIPARINAIKINGNAASSLNIKLGNDTQNDITVTVQDITTSTTLNADGGTVTGHLLVHTWSQSIDGNDATPAASGSFTFEIDTVQYPAS